MLDSTNSFDRIKNLENSPVARTERAPVANPLPLPDRPALKDNKLEKGRVRSMTPSAPSFMPQPEHIKTEKKLIHGELLYLLKS